MAFNRIGHPDILFTQASPCMQEQWVTFAKTLGSLVEPFISSLKMLNADINESAGCHFQEELHSLYSYV